MAAACGYAGHAGAGGGNPFRASHGELSGYHCKRLVVDWNMWDAIGCPPGWPCSPTAYMINLLV